MPNQKLKIDSHGQSPWSSDSSLRDNESETSPRARSRNHRLLKIAILIDQLIPGGVQKVAIEEVRNLRKLGFDSSLLILMRKGFKNKNHYLTSNIPYQFLSDRYPKFFQKSFKLPIFRFLSSLHLLSPILAPLQIKTKEFDIIISHGTTTSLTTWTISRFRKIPYIAVIHDPMVYILEKIYQKTPLSPFFPIIKPLASFLEKHLITSAKTCLVDSNVHAAYIENNYKVKPQVLHLQVSPPKKIPAYRGDKIISFGRWDAGKNLTLLLDLMQKLPSTKLIIAGSWSSASELKEFKRQIQVKKLQNNIELITYYRERDLANICRQGRFFLHPHFESFSLSALEAASFGLPIIIPQKSGITELFENGKHGFFPKKMSKDKLLKLAQKLLDDERLAWQMGREAAKIVRKLASESTHAKGLAKIILSEKTPAFIPGMKAESITNSLNHQKKLVALETGQVGTQGVAGGDQLLKRMLKRIKTPFEVTVIVPPIHTKGWQKSGTSVKLLELPNSAFDKSTNQLIVFANYIIRSARNIRILLKKQPDVIYSATEILPDVIPAYVTKIIKPHTFWIARSHHLWQKAQERPGNYFVNLASGLIQSIILKAIKGKADILLALNDNLKFQLEDQGFEPRKVVVLGGGVDYRTINQFKPISKEGYDAVYLGRIHATKGVYDLPHIWSIVVRKKKSSRLAIIGTGSQDHIKNLKKMIISNKLKKNISILGFISQKRLYTILKNSKVFLFCDHEAGWGLAVAEAMASGLPVVGWDIGILGSVFKSGFIKVPLNDFEKFARNTVRILQDTSLHSKLSIESTKEAARLDWQKASHKFIKILNEINSYL